MSNIFDMFDCEDPSNPLAMTTQTLRQIGTLVRQRREDLGLTQQRLARLADLSRATINQLETGVLVDLGVRKLALLLDLLGLTLEAGRSAAGAPQRALRMASRTASVSYKARLEPQDLARALATGDLPPQWVPHVATLLDEAPLSLLVSAVEEAAHVQAVPPKRIWRHVSRWAADLRSPRPAWS